MPIDQNELERRRKALTDIAARFAAEAAEAYVRPDLGAQMAFEPLRPSIEAILHVSRMLVAAPLDALPGQLLVKALNAFSHIEGRLGELKAFDMVALTTQNTNPVTHRTRLLNEFDPSDNSFWEQIAPVLGYLGVVRVERDPSFSVVHSLVGVAQDAVLKATESQGQLESIVSAAREAAANVGVAKHAALFASEAVEQTRVARKWLVATGVSAALTLGAAALNLVGHVRGWEAAPDAAPASAYSVGLLLAKVFLFSILLSAIIWCGKIYKASLHNAIVNRHRQNALATFQAFVAGATDDQTRNAVLLQAAQSVFMPQNSGYVTGEADTAGPTTLIEMVRTITPAAK